MKSKPKVLFVLNQLKAGTGPFQRAIRLDDNYFEINILSCFDTTNEIIHTASLLHNDFGSRKLVGLGEKNKFKLFFKLLKYIYVYKPSLIQVNHTYSSVICIFSKLLFPRIKIVAFEGTLFSRFSNLKQFFLKFLFSLADATICVSDAVRSNNNFWLGNKNKRYTIYNGVDHIDIDRAIKYNKFDLDLSDKFILGYVGDLKAVKDIRTLIKAVHSLPNKSDNILLLIVGDGELKKTLAQMVVELNIEDKVIFTGGVERFEVYSLLKVMNIFIMPSLAEGLSEAIAQAMASSLPVIASDIEPNAEIIKNKKNGYLFPVGNYKQLAKLIGHMYSDRKHCKEIGLYNKKVSTEKLDINEVVLKYKQLYLSLTNHE